MASHQSRTDDTSVHTGDRQTGKTRRVRKRKSTYRVQKEEKDALLKQQSQLQTHLDALRLQQQLGAEEQEQSILYKELVNRCLRATLQEQQHSMVSLQSVFSAYVSAQEQFPFEMHIHLPADPKERQNVLINMRSKKLYEARRYITERSRHIAPLVPLSEHSRFVAANGDYCMAFFEVTPFEGIQSVKQVFDALQFFFTNMEIRISEILGEITVRSDDDCPNNNVSQTRLISTITEDVHMEINMVRIWDYQEQEIETAAPEVLMTVDFVDQDDLFPHDPSKYIRQDVTAVLTVQPHARKIVNMWGEEEEKTVVVLTRCAFIKIRQTDLPIPNLVRQFLRDNIGRWSDLMIKSVREMVYSGYADMAYKYM